MAMDVGDGATLGRYELISSLGSGGMATVYKAFHRALDRTVALKVIRADLSRDPEFVERFRAEAKTVARLRHPHIVQVYDFDEAGGRHFIVMEYLEGGSLYERVAAVRKLGQRIPPLEIARIVGEAAEGLAHAHGLGILHRDVKPANILFTRDGRAVVTDFGLAKMLMSVGRTQTGFMMGTPEYMSPEQARGLPTDARTDVYALGVVAYELLTGRAPYVADSPLAVALSRMSDPLPLPSAIDPRVHGLTESALVKVLALEPNDRYGSTTEFAHALTRAITESGPEALGTAAATPVAPQTAPSAPPRPASAPRAPSTPPSPTTIAITFPSGPWLAIGIAAIAIVVIGLALVLRGAVGPSIAVTPTASLTSPPTGGVAPIVAPGPGQGRIDLRGITDGKTLPRGAAVLRRDSTFTSADFTAGPRAPTGSASVNAGEILLRASEPAAAISIRNTHRVAFIADYAVNVPPDADVRILLCFRGTVERQACFVMTRGATTLEVDSAAGPAIIARTAAVVPFGGTLFFTLFIQETTYALYASDRLVIESQDPRITSAPADVDLVVAAQLLPGARGGDVRLNALHVFDLAPPPSGRP